MAANRTKPTTIVGAVSREAQIEALESMVLAVPEGEAGDELEMLLRVAQATTPEGANIDGGLPSLLDLVGHSLKIDSISRHAGDMEAYGKAWFIVADALDVKSGEMVRFQTSATVALMQLVKWFQLGAYPVWVDVKAVTTRNKQQAINLVLTDSAISA